MGYPRINHSKGSDSTDTQYVTFPLLGCVRGPVIASEWVSHTLHKTNKNNSIIPKCSLGSDDQFNNQFILRIWQQYACYKA